MRYSLRIILGMVLPCFGYDGAMDNHPTKKPSNNKKKGSQGEETARLFLIKKGYQVVESNWQCGKNSGIQGEIDLICISPCNQLLVFIEVKARKNSAYGNALEAVTLKKQQQIMTLAEQYLSMHKKLHHLQLRFDVVSLTLQSNGYASDIKHLENAFGR